MVYYVFDLDQTLIGDIGPFTDYLENFKDQELSNPPNAYTYFVKLIADQEASENPIGLLRPEILKFMNQIAKQNEARICQGAVIYSNNSYLKSLEFVRDIIHTYLGVKNLFCACIERHHAGRPGHNITNNPPKSFEELKKILLDENICNVTQNLQLKDIIFFDDRQEKHTIYNEFQSLNLTQNYIQVEEYKAPYEINRSNKSYEDLILLFYKYSNAISSNNTQNTLMNVGLLNLENLLDNNTGKSQTKINSKYNAYISDLKELIQTTQEKIKQVILKSATINNTNIQEAINRYNKQIYVEGGRQYAHTRKNRFKQKKEQRKQKYRQHRKKGSRKKSRSNYRK